MFLFLRRLRLRYFSCEEYIFLVALTRSDIPIEDFYPPGIFISDGYIPSANIIAFIPARTVFGEALTHRTFYRANRLAAGILKGTTWISKGLRLNRPSFSNFWDQRSSKFLTELPFFDVRLKSGVRFSGFLSSLLFLLGRRVIHIADK